jgi:hypothetical protein
VVRRSGGCDGGLDGLPGALRGVAEAGVIASHFDGEGSRAEDLAKVQAFLENKVVVQKLIDYGVSPEEAKAKVEAMSAQELHRLASLSDRVAEGATDGWEVIIFILIIVILVIVILKLTKKEVIIR